MQFVESNVTLESDALCRGRGNRTPDKNKTIE